MKCRAMVARAFVDIEARILLQCRLTPRHAVTSVAKLEQEQVESC
jgi:hypothetical protein